MNDLLQHLDPDPRLSRGRGVPLMMEFPVETGTSPYLVSTSTSLLWVTEPLSNQMVRAAVRHIKDTGAFFREVLDEIAEMGLENEWSNVSPGNLAGVEAAISYVRSYDLPEVEVLAAPKKTDMVIPHLDEVSGCPVHRVDWLHGNLVVALPKDRAYLGFLSRFGSSRALSVIHNPSRGVGIARV